MLRWLEMIVAAILQQLEPQRERKCTGWEMVEPFSGELLFEELRQLNTTECWAWYYCRRDEERPGDDDVPRCSSRCLVDSP